MNTTTPQLTHARPPSATARTIAPRRRGSASPDQLTWGEVFDEGAPLIGAPAFFGPPISFVLGPWLLPVLLLIGPFALILTILLAMAVAAGLVAVLVAVIASPYLLMRHLHGHGIVHPRARVAPAPDPQTPGELRPARLTTTEGRVMKIVVIGGTGLIGSKLVTKLRENGHRPVAASPDAGVNTVAGEGVSEVLDGAHVVLDVSNAPDWDDDTAAACRRCTSSGRGSAGSAAALARAITAGRSSMSTISPSSIAWRSSTPPAAPC
jgi:hypothetical protein